MSAILRVDSVGKSYGARRVLAEHRPETSIHDVWRRYVTGMRAPSGNANRCRSSRLAALQGGAKLLEAYTPGG